MTKKEWFEKCNQGGVEPDLMDDELKIIMGNRYQDESHLFTPAAQDKRRNNRLMFTRNIAILMGVLCGFMTWMNQVGIMSTWLMALGVSVCSIVVGYNVGVCICHNKGWRGA